MEKHALMSQ